MAERSASTGSRTCEQRPALLFHTHAGVSLASARQATRQVDPPRRPERRARQQALVAAGRERIRTKAPNLRPSEPVLVFFRCRTQSSVLMCGSCASLKCCFLRLLAAQRLAERQRDAVAALGVGHRSCLQCCVSWLPQPAQIGRKGHHHVMACRTARGSVGRPNARGAYLCAMLPVRRGTMSRVASHPRPRRRPSGNDPEGGENWHRGEDISREDARRLLHRRRLNSVK